MLTILLLALALPLQSTGGGLQQLHRFDGVQQDQAFGSQVAGAGDVNADGHADLLVNAPWSDYGYYNNGAVAVYSGVDGSLLHSFLGSAQDEYFTSISTAGDVDADGYADLLLGISRASPQGILEAGSAEVMSGRTGALLFRFSGSTVAGWFGDAVASAGDVNADGHADLLIGERGAGGGGFSGAGAAHVYSGADGALLFSFFGGATMDFLGARVAGAGDVNADGRADLLILAPRADPGGISDAGSIFVHSGADGSLLYAFHGIIPGGYLDAAAGAGDVNGDGHADFVLGEAFGSHGSRLGFGAVRLISGATGLPVYVIHGTRLTRNLGGWVGGAGDMDGDEIPDFLATAYVPGFRFTNLLLVYSGRTGEEIFRFDAEEPQAFNAAASAGDVDGDGRPDLIFGNIAAGPGGIYRAGSAFVLSLLPFLEASQHELSIAAGGAVQFNVQFPSQYAGGGYRILASMQGTGPAWVGGLRIPLTRDEVFHRTLIGHSGPFATGFSGRLDAQGRATASLHPTAGQLPPALAGVTMHFAAVANAAGAPPRTSIPQRLTLRP